MRYNMNMKTKQITKLDLGGTACYESSEAVGVSLDGTGYGDATTPRVIADYRHLPFPKNHFEEAFGSCFLEEEDEEYGSLYRDVVSHMKSGGRLIVKGCGPVHPNHILHGEESELRLVEEPGVYDNEEGGEDYDSPMHWEIP